MNKLILKVLLLVLLVSSSGNSQNIRTTAKFVKLYSLIDSTATKLSPCNIPVKYVERIIVIASRDTQYYYIDDVHTVSTDTSSDTQIRGVTEYDEPVTIILEQNCNYNYDMLYIFRPGYLLLYLLEKHQNNEGIKKM